MQEYIEDKLNNFGIPKSLSHSFSEFVRYILYIIVYSRFCIKSIFQHRKNLPSFKEIENYLNSIQKIPDGTHIFNRNNKLDMNVDLAIIIPTYNSDQFIQKSLSSALNQHTHFSYVVVVINDGSTDNTSEILKGFSNNRHCIVINQENKGFSGARNTGLDFIGEKAKYIFFLDSDDTLSSKNSVNTLLNSAFKYDADMVDGSYNVVHGLDLSSNILANNVTYSGIDSSLSVVPYPWGKVMRTELWRNVRFPERFSFEDTVLPFLINPYVKTYVSTSDLIYNYTINEKGITLSSKGKIKNLDTLYIIKYLLKSVKLPMNDYLSSVVLYQLTRRMSRILPLDLSIQKAAFLYSCHLVDMYISNETNLSKFNKFVLQIFKSRDFETWKLIVKLRLS